MKRALCSAAALIMALLLLVGCGNKGNPLPEGMDEETLLAVGREVVLELVGGDYEAVYQRLRLDQRELYTADDIRSLALKQLDGAGVYREIVDAMVSGQKAQDQEIGVAMFHCTYSEDTVLIRVSFDPEMQLVGISLQKS